MYQQYGNQGFQVLSIGYNETVGNVNSWVSMFNLTYPVVRDAGGSVSLQYIPVQGGYLYFPHNTLIDTWQVVRYTATGFNENTIESMVTALMDPVGSANVTELDFGQVVLGGSGELTFTIDNVGTGILEVSGITSSCPSFSADPTSGSVYAVDDLMEVTVTYTPQELGTCNETLTIATNDEPIVIDLIGECVATSVPPAQVTAIPASLGLDPCYPNPFNAETVIPFRLPQASDVSIVIYSVEGRTVDQIDLGVTSPGYHRVTWSPTNSTTGVYFVELRSDGHRSSMQKILYLK